MKNNNWIDSQGTSHGNWCREKFFELTCKHCKQRVWYLECSHGCKVYFHKVPWRDGEWDTTCPNYSYATNFNYDLRDKSENFKYNLSDSQTNDFNYDLGEETTESFNYNLRDDELDDFNYDLTN